jgi:hypothetical protein
VTRDPEASRLAARVLLLYAYDRTSARLLGRLAELHLEAARRLQTTETAAVEAHVEVERVSGSGADPDEVMLGLAGRLAAAAGRLRALTKARRQGLRREVERYELALDLRDPPKGRPHTLASGQQVQAVQWAGPDGIRHVEPP